MPLPLSRPGVSLFVAVVPAAAMCLALSGPALAGDPLADIKINEVESEGLADFIELMNTSGTPTDVSGLVLKDSDDTRTLAIPGGASIPAGGFLAVDTDVPGGFGLGSSDAARVFLPDGTTLIDGYSWTAHAGTTYGRCPDGTGAFVPPTQSPGAPPTPARQSSRHGRAARRSPLSTRRGPSAATSAASTTRAPAPGWRECFGRSTTAAA